MGTLTFQATLGGAVNVIGPNTTSTTNFTLPSADGSNGQALLTNGSGVLSFATLGVAGGGTGITSYTPNTILFANSSTTLTSTTGLTFTGTNLGIGTSSPAVKLAISSTDAVLLPVGTTAQRPTGASGYIRFNSDNTKFEGYNGTTWTSVGGGATGGGADQVFIQNGQTVTTDYTITTNYNAGTFGPVSINTGVTVTVPTGSVWTVV
jgi:hypothetical protein